MATKKALILNDGSGGLNNRDNPSEIKQNEWSRLENCVTDEGGLFKKRFGKDLINYTPIDPQEAAVCCDTLGLWPLNDASAPWLDSSANAYDLNPVYTGPVSAPGMFPIGAGLGAQFTPTDNATDRGPIFRATPAVFNNKAQATFQGWFKINASFSGGPLTIQRFGHSYDIVNSGAVLVGTTDFAGDGVNPGDIVNGLTIHRDWDATDLKDSSDPYVKFTLKTKGAGATTVIESGALPTGKFIHLRGTYNSTTGLMKLYVNGNLMSSASPLGAGLIDDSASTCIVLGGVLSESYIPSFPAANGAIYDALIVGNIIYVFGAFTTFGGETRNRAAAFNKNTNEILPWNPDANGTIFKALYNNGIIYFGGIFNKINGLTVTRAFAAAVDSISGIATAWNPSLDDGFDIDMVLNGNTIYMVGSFKIVNGAIVRNHAAAFDLITGTDQNWNPDLDDAALTIVISGGLAYIGGVFTTANTVVARNRACAVDLVVGLLAPWNPDFNDAVYDMIIDGSTIYAGGMFTTVNGGVARNRICAVDAVTAVLTAWNPDIDGPVVALISRNTEVIAGGNFTTIGGVTRNYVGGIYKSTGLPTVYNPDTNNQVRFFINDNDVIFMCGTFTTISGQPALYFGAWWQPIYKMFSGTMDDVQIIQAEEITFPFKKPRGLPMPFMKSDGTNQCVISAEDWLFYTLGDGVMIPILGGFSTTAYWDFLQVGDVLYLSNGVDNPVSWDGITLRPWGEGTTMLSAIPIAGAGMTASDHDFVYTFFYGDYETGPSVLVTASPAAGNLQVIIQQIPTGTSRCTARGIYMTKANTPGEYYLVRKINDNVTTSLLGAYVAGVPAGPETDTGAIGVADAALVGDYVPMSAITAYTAIKKFKYLQGAHSRVFACGDTNRPFDLFWSELASPEVFRAAGFTRADTDRGPLTSIASYYTEIHCSKNGEATLVLRGDGPDNWTQLETLHPDLGSLDHWGNVHRTIPGHDQYMLCFPAKDGHFYGYQGQDFFRVSDQINGTIQDLAQSNATKNDWILTTQAQFQSQYAPGNATTQNVKADAYSVDGLREDAGQVKIVNQLDYMGLWTGDNPLITGKITAIAKGPAEGEFYFAGDADNNLHRTTNNFLTQTTLSAIGAATDRIIEITYASIYNATTGTMIDNLFLFAEDTTGKGPVYRLEDPTGTFGVGPNLSTLSAGPYYWQADTKWRIRSVANVINGLPGFAIGALATPFGFVLDTSSPNNLYLNHQQRVFGRDAQGTAGFDEGLRIYMLAGSSTLNGVNKFDNVFQYPTGFGPNAVFFTGNKFITSNTYFASSTPGFYSLYRRQRSYNPDLLNTTPIFSEFTNRETALWKGGSFRPQSFYANGSLFFVGAGAEDAQGNRTSAIYKHNMTALSTIISGFSFYSLTTDGTNGWFVDQLEDTVAENGFISSLKRFPLATGVVTTVGALGTNILPLRLSWNVNNGKLVAIGKKWAGTRDNYTYTGFIGRLNTTTGAYAEIKAFTANGNGGAYPVEIAYQTETPFAHFVGVNLSTATDLAFYTVPATGSAVATLKALPFESGVGLRSNLLFVKSSGAAGGNLWADRLYYGNDTVSNVSAVQLGVPGNWTVIGIFESEAHDFGTFDSYENFDADFQGFPIFAYRIGANVGALAAAVYATITPNQKLIGFAADAYGQWRATITWNYAAGSTPTASDSLNFVDVGFFLGNINIPRVIGLHFNGRTYWSVAESGELANNMVVVYQGNNGWTTYRGWNISGMRLFRNQFVGFEGYQFNRFETGTTDAGNIIRSLARTGYLGGDKIDKLLRELNVNLQSYINGKFPNRRGWMKLVSYKGNTALSNVRVFPIPQVAQEEEPTQVRSRFMTDGFGYAWARQVAMQIMTSDEVSGDYVPAVDQTEKISSLVVDFWMSGRRMSNPTVNDGF